MARCAYTSLVSSAYVRCRGRVVIMLVAAALFRTPYAQALFEVNVEKERSLIETHIRELGDLLAVNKLQQSRATLRLIEDRLELVRKELPRDARKAFETRIDSLTNWMAAKEDSLVGVALDMLYDKGMDEALDYVQQDLRRLGLPQKRLEEIDRRFMEEAPKLQQKKEEQAMARAVKALEEGRGVPDDVDPYIAMTAKRLVQARRDSVRAVRQQEQAERREELEEQRRKQAEEQERRREEELERQRELERERQREVAEAQEQRREQAAEKERTRKEEEARRTQEQQRQLELDREEQRRVAEAERERERARREAEMRHREQQRRREQEMEEVRRRDQAYKDSLAALEAEKLRLAEEVAAREAKRAQEEAELAELRKLEAQRRAEKQAEEREKLRTEREERERTMAEDAAEVERLRAQQQRLAEQRAEMERIRAEEERQRQLERERREREERIEKQRIEQERVAQLEKFNEGETTFHETSMATGQSRSVREYMQERKADERKAQAVVVRIYELLEKDRAKEAVRLFRERRDYLAELLGKEVFVVLESSVATAPSQPLTLASAKPAPAQSPRELSKEEQHIRRIRSYYKQRKWEQAISLFDGTRKELKKYMAKKDYRKLKALVDSARQFVD